MAIRPGLQAADPVGPEHAEDHARDGARRGREAAARAGADRGDAAVRGHDARADRRRRPGRRLGPRAAAAPAARDDGGDADRPALRRPRARRRVQRAGACAARSRSSGGSRPRARRCAGSASARRGARRSRSGGASSTGRSSASPTRPAYADAQAIAHRAAELFVEGEVDRVVLVYNTFVSALTQTVTEQEILPISADVLETDEEERRDDALRGDFIFEPEPEEILERLLPVYVETQVYRALLESSASEQGARMTAMRNASKNAGELIDSADARDEPRPPGGDHAGDPRGRRRRRRAGVAGSARPRSRLQLERFLHLLATGHRDGDHEMRHGPLRIGRAGRSPRRTTIRRSARPIRRTAALFSTRSRVDDEPHIRRAPRPRAR